MIELPQLNNKENQCLMYFFTKRCSKTEAFKSAYNCENMSDNAVYVEASRFFSNPKITLWLNHYQKNTQETIQEQLNYDAKKHFDELDELKGIALNCFDKNGNPNINAAIKTTELKGKLAGLYKDDKEDNSNNVVNVMGAITLDGKQLKFAVGDEYKENNANSTS